MNKTKNLYGVIALVLVLAIVLYLMFGSYSISLNNLLHVLTGKGSMTDIFVITKLRLPRMLIVIFAGAALALSGSILQSITHNDLADPGIIGINAGAGLGVTVFFLMFSHSAKDFAFILPFAAFMGAFMTSLAIFLLSRTRGLGLDPMKMILIGIGFSMALSGFMIILISSAERTEVEFIANWLAGNIWGGDWPFVYAIVPLIIILSLILYYNHKTLNVLQLGKDTSIGLGVNMEKTHYFMLSLATLFAALAVSVAGSIAFLGLIAPHIAKRLVGKRNEIFLPLTSLLGGTLLLIADLLARNLIEPNGMPTGIIVSLIGAPYFIYLLIRRSKVV